jgi:hypothetical protein
MSSWQDHYDYAFDQFLDQNDPDDWEGREYEYCVAQDEYACDYADNACADEEDDDDDYDDGYDDDNRPGPGGQGLASQSNEEWFATLGEFNS